MPSRFKLFRADFPAQFWLMFVGMLISTIGASMIWPFLMIYVSETLDQPLTVAASLMTLNSAAGLVSSFIAGPIIDRLGRKWVMVGSLFSNAIGYILMSQAHSLPAFAALMMLQGSVNPLYRVGADAMMADLIPAEKRVDAYSLLRLSNNIGVAIGPAVGGFIASQSYVVAFFCAAAGLGTYGLLLALRAKETLPQRSPEASQVKERFGGYGRVLRDGPFVSFSLAFTLTQIGAAMVWVLLAVYTKTNFGLSESQYGMIPMTNAIMVVLFQIPVTQWTKKYSPHRMMALGALFYAVAVGSVAFGRGFWGFWVSMVIMTIGELILVPTTSTFAANLAPADMRGRYMSIYGLTWGAAAGIGPVLGGLLNDNLFQGAMWYGGSLIGLVSVVMFMIVSRLHGPGGKKETSLVGETQAGISGDV